MIWLLLACSTPSVDAPTVDVPAPSPPAADPPPEPGTEGGEPAPPAGRIGGEPILSTPVVLGAIDNQAVTDVVDALELGSCPSERHGKVLVQFIISPLGTVHQQKVLSTSLRDPAAEQCLLDLVGAVRFAELESGTKALVKYPFSL